MKNRQVKKYIEKQGYTFVRRAKHGMLYRKGTRTILIAHSPNYQQPMHKILNNSIESLA